MPRLPPPVTTKKDFVRRYQLGEFGNRSPTYDNLRHFVSSNPPSGLYHIRNRIAGGPTFYDVPCEEVQERWDELTLEKDISPENLYISAMAPTAGTLIQGELMRGVGGLYLHYTNVRKPMRDALKEESHHATGLTVKILLETYLNVKSLEWMYALLDRYPDHVIEFSVYNQCWGTDPGFNTVFWEVRQY